MITLQTYCLEPFIAANAKTAPLTTEWLRDAVNKLMRNERKLLEDAGADVSLFYNHDSKNTRIGFPLIIYHYIGGVFYITGINEGAMALTLLTDRYNSPFNVDDVVFQGFKKENGGGEFDLCSTDELRSYQMTKWIPLNHDPAKKFKKMDMLAKVIEMNEKLGIHLSKGFGEYFGIKFTNLTATITDITRVYPEPVVYKGYHYPAFDIRFTANVSLPRLITLGNIQALGYGRVEPI